MKLVLNSIWNTSESDLNLPEKLVRIIEIYPEQNGVVLYPILNCNQKMAKPQLIELQRFEEMIETGEITSDVFEIPGFMLEHEDNIKKNEKEERDKKYKLIERLVKDRVFIYQYASENRSKLVTNYARKIDTDAQIIYRYLRDYWQYGMIENGLLYSYSNSGGRGVKKKLSDKKVGSPIKKSKFGFKINEGQNVTKKDKSRIKKGFKKFYGSGASLKQAYEDTKNEFYSDEIRIATENVKKENTPTLRQFVYWGRELTSSVDIEISRNPKGDYERNQRGMEKSVSSSTNGPGEFFEIDATPADIHIVLELNRNIPIGRPYIYSITDRASRMIVGFYVCLENPSWYAASLAISNAFMPKVEYCQLYNIQITEEDWPCSHIPANLVCDRGEMKGKKPASIIPKLGPTLQLLPPYRPDMKSIVERRFGILNEECLHALDGTTKGRITKRGEIDPKEKAIYTLKEVTEILLREVLEHNNYQTFSELRTQDLIKFDLEPTPLNFWNYYLNNHQHSLQIRAEEDIKALLLPKKKAVVTKYGIRYGEVYYICELAQKESWLTIARNQGYWNVEARFDENTPDYLWIRPGKGKKFIKCTMLPRSNEFRNLTYPDILYISEWTKHNKQTHEGQLCQLENYERKKEIKENALEEKSKHIAPKSKRAKTKNMRENRNKEKERIKKERYDDTNLENKNIVQFPIKKKVSGPLDDSLDLICNLWEEESDNES